MNNSQVTVQTLAVNGRVTAVKVCHCPLNPGKEMREEEARIVSIDPSHRSQKEQEDEARTGTTLLLRLVNFHSVEAQKKGNTLYFLLPFDGQRLLLRENDDLFIRCAVFFIEFCSSTEEYFLWEEEEEEEEDSVMT